VIRYFPNGKSTMTGESSIVKISYFFGDPESANPHFLAGEIPIFSPSFGLLTSLALRSRRRVRQQRHGARIRRGEGRQVETRLSWQKIGLKMVIYW